MQHANGVSWGHHQQMMDNVRSKIWGAPGRQPGGAGRGWVGVRGPQGTEQVRGGLGSQRQTRGLGA